MNLQYRHDQQDDHGKSTELVQVEGNDTVWFALIGHPETDDEGKHRQNYDRDDLRLEYAHTGSFKPG